MNSQMSNPALEKADTENKTQEISDSENKLEWKNSAKQQGTASQKKNGKENVYEGLVLQNMDYKDFDGIIRAAGENEVYGIYARGIQRQSSRNRKLAAAGTKIRFEFDPRYSSDLLFLLQGEVVKDYDQSRFTLEQQAVCAIIEEMVVRYGSSPMRYALLEEAWKAFDQKQESKGITACCLLIKDVLEAEGIGINTDECVLCESRDGICTVDPEAGGFVCHRHEARVLELERWKKEDLRRLRSLVHAKAKHLDWLDETYTFSWNDIQFLLDWYTYHLNARPASFRFFQSLTVPKL